MPSRNHGLAQAYLTYAVLKRHDDKYAVVTELSLELEEGKPPLVPDLSIYPKHPTDWRHDAVRETEPPLLVIEILSPKQGMDDLITKADAYFAAGVKSCWIVQPALEAIAILSPDSGEKPKLFAEGEVEDPATGITIRVEDVFR